VGAKMRRRSSLRQKYENLKIRHLRLQSKYYRLKAQRLAGVEPTPFETEAVSRKKYLLILAKLRRCQEQLAEHRLLHSIES